jgi:alkanesulfonate monooxygenase SsuD/methylene tetrahydromethanopterin reductase-like flavin-dependent oxidoreductase (luciferase family)
VKLEMFHLMPYRELPADFAETYRSVWVDIPSHLFDPERANAMFNDTLDELELAATVGYDGVCVNEHHQNAYGLMPSPNIMAASLARRTRDVALIVLGNSIALYNPPVRVAEELAMLDVISGGRLVAGFPVGTSMDTNFAYGQVPADLREKYYEAHDLIVKAWTTDDVFEWVSPNYEFRYVNVWPRPLQEPHPPIYIPGAGSTETMKFCAEKRYTYMSVYAPTPVVKRWFDGYRSAANDLGYEPDPERLGLSIPVYVAETDEQAHAEGRQHIEWLYHKGLKQGIERVMPPGYTSLGSLRGMLSARGKAPNEYTYEEIIDNGMAVVGSPDTVGERFEALIDELGFGQIISLMGVGDMPHYRTVKSMELYATQVMPALRRRAGHAQPAAVA